MPDSPKTINCPFYGKHLHVSIQGPILLVDQHGNECAAIRDAYAPCEMEIQGREIDWRLCPVITAISVGL
jgi:hypothetical protein